MMGPSMDSPEVYESVKKWLFNLESGWDSDKPFEGGSTYRSAIYWIKKYCKILKTNPDWLIIGIKGRDGQLQGGRLQDLQSNNPQVREKHEDYLVEFIVTLKHEDYASASIATGVGMIRSFYSANKVPLGKVRSVKIRPKQHYKIPNLQELQRMCKSADLPTRTWICCQKDSGLANDDLLYTLNLQTKSSEYGTIRKQLNKNDGFIHVEINRGKTGERVDTFFGPNAIETLTEHVESRRAGSLFRMCMRSFQDKVKLAAIRAKVTTKDFPVTPYCLRRFFNINMKFGDPYRDPPIPGANEAIVERMMGHSIGRVRSAYMPTGRTDTFNGMSISTLAKVYMMTYPAIDITKV